MELWKCFSGSSGSYQVLMSRGQDEVKTMPFDICILLVVKLINISHPVAFWNCNHQIHHLLFASSHSMQLQVAILMCLQSISTFLLKTLACIYSFCCTVSWLCPWGGMWRWSVATQGLECAHSTFEKSPESGPGLELSVTDQGLITWFAFLPLSGQLALELQHQPMPMHMYIYKQFLQY